MEEKIELLKKSCSNFIIPYYEYVSDFVFSRYSSPSSHLLSVSDTMFSASDLDMSDFSKKLFIESII